MEFIAGYNFVCVTINIQFLKQMQSYLYTSCSNIDHSKYSQLLYLIAAHPSFKSRVNSFLPLFPYKLSGDGIIKMGSLIYAALLPDSPRSIQRKMAVQLFNSLQINADEVTYTHLTEYLLRICSDLIENIDVKSAIGALEMLESRITDHFIIDAADDEYKQKLQTSIKLQIFDADHIINESQLPEKFHRKAGQLTYYEQRIVFEEPKNLKPTQLVIKKLKEKPEQIFPIGYIMEQFSFDFINNNFETKNSYRLGANRNIHVREKIDYWVNLNGTASNVIRDNVINEEIYCTLPVLSFAHLPQEISPASQKNLNIYRINSAFVVKNYYQKLKQKANPGQQGKNKYFNILSEYYERDQFNIDEIALTNDRYVIQQKEAQLGISGKQVVTKQTKDPETYIKYIPESINKNKKEFLNENRMEDNIKELSRSLRNIISEGTNLNFTLQKHLSSTNEIPRELQNPFKGDIIDLANISPLQILMIGRAKSGKSTLAKQIAKIYKLNLISLQSILNKVMERGKEFKQNPPEPDQDGNIKGGLLKIEECILSDLEEGKCIEDEDILDLINLELKKPETLFKGFIMDLPFEYNQFWYEAIKTNRICLPKIKCRFFNKIIQIDQTEEEWHFFLKGLMLRPEDLTTTSELDRYFLTKPKPPPVQGQQQQEEPQDDGQKPPPPVESKLLNVKWEKYALPLIEHLSIHTNPLDIIKVKNSIQCLSECIDSLKYQLYQIPHAKKIEGSEKQLLTVGLQEQKIARKWSPWGLVDCVELNRQKMMMGKFENAAEYAGRVFVFENQENLNNFLIYPNRYLQKLPVLPAKTNIFINGPRKSGKKTLAKLISDIYGLKIVDIQEILAKVIQRQKEDEAHVPSNPDRTSRSVHLSEPQYKEFYKGMAINAKNILPIVLFELGIPLQKKPPGWGIEKSDEDGGNEQPVEEKKPPPKKAKKKDKNEDQRPKTPPLQDINLKDLIPKINHKKKLDELKGYIFIGYPNNQQQLGALDSFKIPIDKLILLSDNSEENPYKTLSKRLTEAEMEQVANFMTNFAPVKEALGEEKIKQLTNLDASPQQLVNKIRQFIDPFYPKTDEDTINRVCADKPEEGDPIPMGFCGEYCPVALAQGWLIKGKEQFEAGFEGKRFRFVGENQLNCFKQNPMKYLNKQNLQIPPRIMFMGLRGVGLKTQLLKINQNYKIPIINFKQTLIQMLENEKSKRKTQRYYNKGFKIPEYDEEGKLVEDPQINDDGPDFEKGPVEIDCTKKMFNGIGEIFMNGNYFDVEEETISTPFVDLLAQARRLPQTVFMLKSNEQKWLMRNLDKKKIEEELEQIKEKRREEKLKEREEARQKAEQNGEQYQEPEQEEQDPEVPKIEDMIQERQTNLKTQMENDTAKLEELAEAFKSWNVEVIQIDCSRDPKHVYDRINHLLKPYLTDRMNKWQQNNMLSIERHRVPDFINNYIARNSRFEQLNPFTLIKQIHSFPLIYKDRIYYLKDEEQRQKVIRNPQLLETNQGSPKDIKIVPSVAIIGQTKTGKTSLASNISKKMGLVHITIEQIVKNFTQEHKDNEIQDILKSLKEGKTLTDNMLVTLCEKRLKMSDCQHNGWVFDGFPVNKNQCDLLNKQGLLPANIFSLKLSELDIKKRVLRNNSCDDYDYDMEVIHERLEQNKFNIIEVETYFSTKFNNLDLLDAKISKWGLFEIVCKKIQKRIKGRRGLARALVTRSAAPASDIGLDFNCILNCLSDFGNFSPISYKIRRQYIKLCPKHHKNLVMYQKKIYMFKNQAEMNDFLANPENYKKIGNAFSPPQPITECTIPETLGKVENKGYCPVQLTRKNLVKGNPQYILKYHEKYFMLSTPNNMKLFIKNPAIFQLSKIPDKLPIQFQKKSDLKKIAKKNDCTAFLEHHLSNILMKCLAQLGYRRPKYPTLGSKQSALKFLSIILKAINPNKDDEYRQKYMQKLNQFIKQCNYSQQIRQELDRKEKGKWQLYEEENLLKLCQEYKEFLDVLNSSQKNKYFSQFIR